MAASDDRATEAVRRRYNRIAPVYDFMERLLAPKFGGWRRRLWSRTPAGHILEVGVGTGQNLPYYALAGDAEITAIDLSDAMLRRARDKARRAHIKASFQQMDVQHLQFPDNTFDGAAATLVFCSVPDPVRGLTEVARVCKPGARVLLLEHVLSDHRFLAWVMNRANPLTVKIGGEYINRQTAANVVRSGLLLEQVTVLGGAGVFQLIEARKSDGLASPRGGEASPSIH